MKNKKQQILAFFIGLLTILIILEVGLRIAGYCYQKSRVISSQPVTNKQNNSFVILCLGNSFTVGSGAFPGESYPAHLQRLFNERTKEKKAIVVNGGVYSENTAELLDSLEASINHAKPDLIILQTGQPNWWNFYKYSNYLKRTSKDKASFSRSFYYLNDFFCKSRVYRLLFLLKNNIDTKKRIKEPPYKSYRYKTEYGVLGELIRAMDKDFFADEQKVNQAITMFKKGIETDPNYPKNYELLGCIYLYQKSYDAALNLFIKAVTVDPSFRDNYAENRGYQHIRNMRNMPMDGQGDKINKTIDKFIGEFKKTNPKSSENLLFLKDAEISRWVESDIIEIIGIIRSKNIKIILQNYPVSTKFQAGKIDDILRNIAILSNIPFIDNNKIFQEIIATKGARIDEEYFVPDGHCNGRGYKIMATNVYNKIIKEGIFDISEQRNEK